MKATSYTTLLTAATLAVISTTGLRAANVTVNPNAAANVAAGINLSGRVYLQGLTKIQSESAAETYINNNPSATFTAARFTLGATSNAGDAATLRTFLGADGASPLLQRQHPSSNRRVRPAGLR